MYYSDLIYQNTKMLCECGEPLSKKCAHKLCGKCCRDLVCTKHSGRTKKAANKYINDNTQVIIHDIIYEQISVFPNDIIKLTVGYLQNYNKCTGCNGLYENFNSTPGKCDICASKLTTISKMLQFRFL
jgi:hypothetical protein